MSLLLLFILWWNCSLCNSREIREELFEFCSRVEIFEMNPLQINGVLFSRDLIISLSIVYPSECMNPEELVGQTCPNKLAKNNFLNTVCYRNILLGPYLWFGSIALLSLQGRNRAIGQTVNKV